MATGSWLSTGAASSRSRRRADGIAQALYTGLVVVACLLVIALSTKLRHRMDLSLSGGNTLSPQTLGVLERLEEDVWIYPLFTRQHPDRERYWFLLQLYREASPRVRVEFIDPVAQPGAVRGLGLDPSEDNARRDGTTVVVRGEVRRVFFGVSEEAVTNAILDAGATARRVVAFLRGYGERDPESSLPAGMAHAARAMREEYYQLGELDLAQPIPPEVTLVVAAGLRLPLPPEHRAELAAYLERGGRLLVLADPGVDAGLGEILERWGVRATGELLVEPRANVNNDRQFLRVLHYTDHPVVRGFGGGFRIGLPVATVVEHFEPGDPLVFHQALARTTEFAIARALDGSRRQGPFAVAVASWRREEETGRETRVILVGDSDFATNQYLAYGANRNFLLNCLGWLSREQALVTLRREPLANQQLELAPGDGVRLLLAAYGAPLAVALAGVAMFFARRRL